MFPPTKMPGQKSVSFFGHLFNRFEVPARLVPLQTILG